MTNEVDAIPDAEYPSIGVKALNHVTICVFDIDESIKFYADVIGLTRLPRPDFGDQGAWFSLGNDQQLHILVDETGKGLVGRDLTHFALEVDDVRVACASLASRGVDILTRPQLRPDGWGQMMFSDPDGYKIELSSRP